jgi:hypothetical protein
MIIDGQVIFNHLLWFTKNMGVYPLEDYLGACIFVSGQKVSLICPLPKLGIVSSEGKHKKVLATSWTEKPGFSFIIFQALDL